MKKLLIFLMIAIPLVIVIIVNLTVNAVVGTVSISVDAVKLNRDEIIANIDDIVSLKATIYPESATNKDLIWESDNEDVAQVDLNGNVTFVGFGKGYITVTTVDGHKKASCYFYITDTKAHQVILTSPQKEVPIGENMQLRATVLPDEALDKGVTFKSSDESIAKVDANGIVYGVGVGYVTITATTDDGGYTSYLTIAIINPVTNLVVDNNEVVTSAGYHQIGYSIYPLNASNKTVEFIVDNTSIATVNSSGMVSFKKAGTVNVTIRTIDGNFTEVVKITNTDGYAADLILDEYIINAQIGDTAKYINYTTVPSNVINTDVEFLTSDSKVAYVDESGYVQFVGGGSTTITARIKKNENEYIEKNVLVYVESPAESIIIDDTIITAQKQIKLEPTSYPYNSTNNNFYYHSLDNNIATVSSDGIVNFINSTYSSVKVVIYANSDYSDIKKTIEVIYTGGYATDFDLIDNDVELNYGDTYKLNYVIEPQNAVYQDILYEVVEQNGIDGNDVVKVLEDGTIVTLGGGNAVIKLSLKTAQNNIIEKTCNINVIRKVEQIQIQLNLEKINGEYVTGESTVSFDALTLPLDVQNKGVVWSVSDKKMAVIVGNTFKFNYVGVVTLYATSSDGGASTSVDIRYVGPNPTDASVIANYNGQIVEVPTTLYVGDSFDVEVLNVSPSNAIYKNLTLVVSNQITLNAINKVLEIDGNSVTAISGGTATLSVYVSTTVQLVYNITVIRKAESIQVQPSNIETTKSSIVLNAIVLPEDTTDKSVSYFVDDTSIANINNNVLTFKQSGAVQITAISNSNPEIQYTFTITKVDNGSSTIDPTVESVELAVGESFKLDFSSSGMVYDTLSIKLVESQPVDLGDVINIENDLITAVGLGNAVVECYLYDEYGSNIAFYSITINVIQLAEQIVFASQIDQYNGEYITASSEIKLEFDVLPHNTSNKNVTISIDSSYTSNGVASEHIAYIQNDYIYFIQAGIVNILVQSVQGDAQTLIRIRYTGGDALSAELNIASTLTLDVGESVSVNVTKWIPFDTTNTHLSIREISHSQGEEVVNIVDNVITALNGGTSKILIELSNGITKNVTINVIKKVQEIQISTNNILTANNSVTISATALPSNATNKELVYQLKDTNIATLNDRTITFTQAGSVVVLVSTTDGSNITEQINVTSTMGYVSDIVLNMSSGNVNKGMSLNIYPKTIYPLDLGSYNVYYEVLNYSTSDGSDNQVITISSDGVVKGLYGGSATIRVYTYDYYGNIIYSDCLVNVICSTTNIDVDFGNVEYYNGMIITSKETLNFNVNITPNDASIRDIDFVISDSSVANIKDNTIYFQKAGVVTIKYISKDNTNGEISKTYTFYCTYNQLMQAEIDTSDFEGNPKSLTLNAGEDYYFNTTKVIPADFDNLQYEIKNLSEQPIVSNTNVIDFNNGKITARYGGTATFDLYLNNINLGTFKITVFRKATNIIVDNSEVYVSVPSYKIQAKAYPYDTQQTELIYTINDPTIANVSQDGYVEFYKLGKVNVTITLKDNPSIFVSISIEYTKQIKELIFEDTPTQMYVSDFITLTAWPNPIDAEDYEISWRVSNPNLVTLKITDNQCMVKGKVAGTVDITAYIEGTDISVTRTLTIHKKLSDIVLELISQDDIKGIGGYRVFGNQFLTDDGQYYNTYQMKIKSARDTNGALVINPDQTIDGVNLVWSSSNEQIATVNANGLVTFIGNVGQVTITVAQQKPFESATAKYTSYTFNVVAGVNVTNDVQMIKVINDKLPVVLQAQDSSNTIVVNQNNNFNNGSGNDNIRLFNNLYGNGCLLDLSNMSAGTKIEIGQSNVVIDNVILRGATFGNDAALSELREKGKILLINEKTNITIQNTIIENAMICVDVRSSTTSFAGCIIRNSFSGGLIINANENKSGSHVIAKDTIFARSLLSSVILQPFDEKKLGTIQPSTFEMQNNVYIHNWITLDEFQLDAVMNFIPEELGFGQYVEQFVNEAKKLISAQSEYKYVHNNKEYFLLGVIALEAKTPVGTFKSYGNVDRSNLNTKCNYIDGNYKGKVNAIGDLIPVEFNINMVSLKGNVTPGPAPFIRPQDTYENINISQPRII